MNRTIDQMIETFRFVIDGGTVVGLLVGDNELARVVLSLEALQEAKEVYSKWENAELSGTSALTAIGAILFEATSTP